MAKSLNISKLKSQIRQIENKQKQAINKYNREVKPYNNRVKKAISDYNVSVRNYNASVRKNKQIISREINKLHSRAIAPNTYTVSLNTMQAHYEAIDSFYPEGTHINSQQDRILDLIEQEHANSIITANAITNDTFPEEDTDDLDIGNKLLLVSEDLNNRWLGAIYSLNPQNPDATRHFCTSAREIFTEFIELKAPDNAVFEYNPNCEKTDHGNATRREKIKYMMRSKDMDNSVVDFAEADITNILELFHVLSNGTHGEAGRYEYKKLLQIKKRVEQGINFLCEISA